MDILVTWAVLTLAMWFASAVLRRMEIKGGVVSHLVVSGLFGVLLFFTGWVFHVALAFMSFGLILFFSFVAKVLVGAIVLKLTDGLTDRLKVKGFGTAILAALIISVTGTVAEAVLRSIH